MSITTEDIKLSLALPTDGFYLRELDPKMAHTISFYNATGVVGVLDFSGSVVKFTGDADEAAKVFFETIGGQFLKLREVKE